MIRDGSAAAGCLLCFFVLGAALTVLGLCAVLNFLTHYFFP